MQTRKHLDRSYIGFNEFPSRAGKIANTHTRLQSYLTGLHSGNDQHHASQGRPPQSQFPAIHLPSHPPKLTLTKTTFLATLALATTALGASCPQDQYIEAVGFDSPSCYDTTGIAGLASTNTFTLAAGAVNTTCGSFTSPAQSILVRGFGDDLTSCYLVTFADPNCPGESTGARAFSLDPNAGVVGTCQNATVAAPVMSAFVYCMVEE